jgi:hypothetical protein
MAVACHVIAIFDSVKTGQQKSNPSEQWACLQFRAAEVYKGTKLSESQIATPNLMIFPPKNFDFNKFQSGKKYQLLLGAVSSSRGTNWDIVESKEIQ